MHIKSSISRRRLVIGITGLAFVGAIVTATAANGADASRQLPKDVAEARFVTPDEAKGCPRQQCDAVASQERAANFAPARPVDKGKPESVTEASAIAAARGAASNSAAEKAGLPSKAKRMTYGEMNQMLGLGADPLITSDRPVWVVTVHGDMTTDALPGETGKVQHVYTDVFDAPSGQIILEAIGLDALK